MRWLFFIKQNLKLQQEYWALLNKEQLKEIKMKTLKFSFVLAFAWLVLVQNTYANFTKNIHKAWAINSVQSLSVENKFGDINFVSTRSDSVTIDVDIEIKNLSKSSASILANKITFRFNISNGQVSAKTEFGSDFKTNQEFSIIYTINIPADKHLDVVNKYGNVTLGDLNANANFKISYGNIQGGNLNVPGNHAVKLKLKYGNSNFNHINKLDAEIGYGKLWAKQIDQAKFKTEYSIMKISEANTIKAVSKYDHFEFDKANKIDAESKFTNWSVVLLMNDFTIESQYGNIDVSKVKNNFNSIKILNSYGNVSIGLSSDASYLFESESYYCEVKHHTALLETNVRNDKHTHLKGKVGEIGRASCRERV